MLPASLFNMSINLFSGPPGSGKSLLATYQGIEALLCRKNVIANYPFNMDYFKKRKHVGKFKYMESNEITPKALIQWAMENHDRKGKAAKRWQTLVIIDESEMKFNPREWEKGDRMDWIKFLANHRHLNFEFLLIAPIDRMIDRQIRGCIEIEYRCRALKAFGLIAKVMNVLFGGVYVAVPYNYSAKVKLFPPHFYRLHRRKAEVYDTMRMFEGMAGFDEVKEEKKDGSNKEVQSAKA